MIAKTKAHHVKHRTFPTLAVILLVFAVTWLLRELEVIELRLPWIPVILIIFAIGVIFDRLLG